MSRSVKAVSIATSEKRCCPPGRLGGDGRHASVASAESHRVTSPRRTGTRSYALQFPTRHLVLYFGWTRDFIERSCTYEPPTRNRRSMPRGTRTAVHQRHRLTWKRQTRPPMFQRTALFSPDADRLAPHSEGPCSEGAMVAGLQQIAVARGSWRLDRVSRFVARILAMDSAFGIPTDTRRPSQLLPLVQRTAPDLCQDFDAPRGCGRRSRAESSTS